MAHVNNELRVCRSHLWRAFRHIKKQTGFGNQSAVLTYLDGHLRIELGGCVLTAEAEGSWIGQARVPISIFTNVAESFPRGSDNIVFVSTDGNELRIDNVAVPCNWDALVYPRIKMPLRAELTDVLVLPLMYSTEDIERSELSETLASSEERRDKLIGKAARVLAPLSVSEDHLRELVDGLLKEKVKYESGDV